MLANLSMRPSRIQSKCTISYQIIIQKCNEFPLSGARCSKSSFQLKSSKRWRDKRVAKDGGIKTLLPKDLPQSPASELRC